jgi:outer membrane protein TolC
MRNYFDSTLTSLRKSLYETEELYKNGFIEDTDVDQLKLLIADLETNLANMDNQLELGYNGLKFLLGMKASDQVELTESLEGLLSLIDSAFMTASKFDHNDHIDYRLLKKTEQLTYLQMKLGKSAYLPTLRAFYSYQNNAMRDEFDFFNFDKTWYPTQILGVQLDVPIWSSGMRKYKVNQSKLELDKIRVQDTELQQKLNLDLETGQNAFNNAYLIYLNRSKNKDLALKIHQKTEMKYKEGLSSSFDLSQSYNQYLSAEVNYLLAVLDLLIKKSDLDKLLTKASN